jgi:hypothetical protein
LIRFFPLVRPVFEHQFGVSALPSSRPIIEITKSYSVEIATRRWLLESDNRETYLVEPEDGGDGAIGQTIDLILRHCGHLCNRDGELLNSINGDHIPVSDISLDWLGKNIQEDIVIMADDADAGFPLIAGCVCFPSGWSVRDKTAQSVLGIHADVPEFGRTLYPATDKLMRRMKPGKPIWRTNWGIRPSGQLDQSPRHADVLEHERSMITSENAGHRCYFRVEHQTLTRVPGGAILFTIHTDQCTLSELTPKRQQILRGVLSTCPDATLRYKGITPMNEAVLGYLSRCSS